MNKHFNIICLKVVTAISYSKTIKGPILHNMAKGCQFVMIVKPNVVCCLRVSFQSNLFDVGRRSAIKLSAAPQSLPISYCFPSNFASNAFRLVSDPVWFSSILLMYEFIDLIAWENWEIYFIRCETYKLTDWRYLHSWLMARFGPTMHSINIISVLFI